MSADLPKTISKPILFKNGCAIGMSHRWNKGQYCSIMTAAGIVGCGIYDVKTAGHFDLAVAICRGTPAKPLVDPEDLLDAKIVEASPQAEKLGIIPGTTTGREAVEKLLAAGK